MKYHKKGFALRITHPDGVIEFKQRQKAWCDELAGYPSFYDRRHWAAMQSMRGRSLDGDIVEWVPIIQTTEVLDEI